MMMIRLGVNLDHVATLRNARGGDHPDVTQAARIAADAGADGIPAHLREDRRHIRDQDLTALKHATALPLNMEMAPIAEMTHIARAIQPHACCLVPEKREELTTEGGLNAAREADRLKPLIAKLKSDRIRVSLFIDPDLVQVEAAAHIGADIVELHTGVYSQTDSADELARLANAARKAAELGLEVHAGHGIDAQNLARIAELPHLAEVNIGHFIIGEAVFYGLAQVIRNMKAMLR